MKQTTYTWNYDSKKKCGYSKYVTTTTTPTGKKFKSVKIFKTGAWGI